MTPTPVSLPHDRTISTSDVSAQPATHTRLQMTFDAIKKMSGMGSGMPSPRVEYGGNKTGGPVVRRVQSAPAETPFSESESREDLGYFDAVVDED